MWSARLGLRGRDGLSAAGNGLSAAGICMLPGMAGGIVMAAILLLAPFMITISLSAVAALLGTLLKQDAEARHDGSSLIETNV